MTFGNPTCSAVSALSFFYRHVLTVDWKEEMKREMQKWFSATTGNERLFSHQTICDGLPFERKGDRHKSLI